MSDLFTPEEIEKTRLLLELFGSNGLVELSISEPDGFSIEIITTPPASTVAQPVVVPTYAPTPAPRSSQSSAKAAPVPEAKKADHTLNSPMVGIFYTSPSPGDPSFVNVGDTVKIGQTIGLIEAMKVFSEIPAEAAGRIVEVVANTGTLVQQAQPLFKIEPI